MATTRRKFLADVAGAVSTGLVFNLHKSSTAFVEGRPGAGCGLLDLKEHCGLSESVQGYMAALCGLGVSCSRDEQGLFFPCKTLIVPAAVDVDPRVAARLSTYLKSGMCLILESGAAFASPRVFRAHQAMLQNYFGIRVERPVHLWRGKPDRGRVPYVDFDWPHATKIRDFSSVVPLAKDEEGIIALAEGLPAALKRRVGHGTLIYLGSPLGPALWAGEPEARRWLAEVVTRRDRIFC
jgi:hypothetical protein